MTRAHQTKLVVCDECRFDGLPLDTDSPPINPIDFDDAYG